MRDSDGVDLDRFPSAMGIITRLACDSAKQEGLQLRDEVLEGEIRNIELVCPRREILLGDL